MVRCGETIYQAVYIGALGVNPAEWLRIRRPRRRERHGALGGLFEGLDRILTGLLRSITFDQGSEWAEWETIATTYDIEDGFCDPHPPWQRALITGTDRRYAR